MNVATLALTLQAAIAPFVLISGTGLLLLSQTNRFGRSIDRIRLLCEEFVRSGEEERQFVKSQIERLYRRCRILRASIALAVGSLCAAALVVFLLFTGLALEAPTTLAVEALFGAGMLALVASLLLFLWDVVLGLTSVRIKMERTFLQAPPRG